LLTALRAASFGRRNRFRYLGFAVYSWISHFPRPTSQTWS
jgi:hypothetical protein